MKLSTILAIILGVALLGVAVLYFTTPASSLPHFMPGYEVGVTKMHLKHGIGALLLGFAAFAFAWFQSGPKSSHKE